MTDTHSTKRSINAHTNPALCFVYYNLLIFFAIAWIGSFCCIKKVSNRLYNISVCISNRRQANLQCVPISRSDFHFSFGRVDSLYKRITCLYLGTCLCNLISWFMSTTFRFIAIISYTFYDPTPRHPWEQYSQYHTPIILMQHTPVGRQLTVDQHTVDQHTSIRYD